MPHSSQPNGNMFWAGLNPVALISKATIKKIRELISTAPMIYFMAIPKSIDKNIWRINVAYQGLRFTIFTTLSASVLSISTTILMALAFKGKYLVAVGYLESMLSTSDLSL